MFLDDVENFTSLDAAAAAKNASIQFAAVGFRPIITPLTKDTDYAYLTDLKAYQPIGNYALKNDLQNYQPVGKYQPAGDYTNKFEFESYKTNVDSRLKNYQPMLGNNINIKESVTTPKIKLSDRWSLQDEAGILVFRDNNSSTGDHRYALYPGEYVDLHKTPAYQPMGDYALKTDISKLQPMGDYALKTDIPKLQPTGDYALKSDIKDYTKLNDFTLGNNTTDRASVGFGRALVKDANSQLTINYDNDFSGGVNVNAKGGLRVKSGGLSLDSGQALSIRDQFHGLKFSEDVDGPVLYGYSGGKLQAAGNARGEQVVDALKWDHSGNVNITGAVSTPKIKLSNRWSLQDENGILVFRDNNSSAGDHRYALYPGEYVDVHNKPGRICRDVQTPWNDEGGGNAIYLDRHDAKCNDSENLTRMHLQRKGDGNYRWEYRCCSGI